MANTFLIILSVICVGMTYQMPTNNGIIRGGGNALFVVKMDLISIWCIVLPLSFLGLIAAAAGLEQAAGFLLHLANIPCEALLHSLRWLQAHAGLDPLARTGPPSLASARSPWHWPCAYIGIISHTRRNAF